MGRAGNHDARCFWQADIDEAIGRLVFLVRTYQPDVMTTYNEFGGYGHPDHIRTHLVAVGAFARAGDPAWYPEQLAPEHGGTGAPAAEGGLAPWSPAKLYDAGDARLGPDGDGASGWRRSASGSWWSPPEDATPEQLAEFEALRRQDARPRRVDHRRGSTCPRVLDERWAAIQAARDPDQRRQPVRALRQGRVGRVLEPRGVHPARVAGAGARRGDRPVRGARRPGAGPDGLGRRRRAAGRAVAAPP